MLRVRNYWPELDLLVRCALKAFKASSLRRERVRNDLARLSAPNVTTDIRTPYCHRQHNRSERSACPSTKGGLRCMSLLFELPRLVCFTLCPLGLRSMFTTAVAAQPSSADRPCNLKATQSHDLHHALMDSRWFCFSELRYPCTAQLPEFWFCSLLWG